MSIKVTKQQNLTQRPRKKRIIATQKRKKTTQKKNIPKKIRTSQAKNHNIPLQFSSIQAKLKITAKIVWAF